MCSCVMSYGSATKALPSLHCFVTIVVQLTPHVQRTQITRKQPPKKLRKEKTQEKCLGKSEATIELFMNNLVLYLFLIDVMYSLSVAI